MLALFFWHFSIHIQRMCAVKAGYYKNMLWEITYQMCLLEKSISLQCPGLWESADGHRDRSGTPTESLNRISQWRRGFSCHKQYNYRCWQLLVQEEGEQMFLLHFYCLPSPETTLLYTPAVICCIHGKELDIIREKSDCDTKLLVHTLGLLLGTLNIFWDFSMEARPGTSI